MSEDRADTANLLKAIEFASRKHSTQRRKDKDASPYINHPIAVAHLLADTGGVTDLVTLMAAVLHDTIEDTKTTAEELEAQFGRAVRKVVEEMTDDKSLEKAVRKQLQDRPRATSLNSGESHQAGRQDRQRAGRDRRTSRELGPCAADRLPGLDGEGRGRLPGNERPAREALRRGARTGTGEVQRLTTFSQPSGGSRASLARIRREPPHSPRDFHQRSATRTSGV